MLENNNNKIENICKILEKHRYKFLVGEVTKILNGNPSLLEEMDNSKLDRILNIIQNAFFGYREFINSQTLIAWALKELPKEGQWDDFCKNEEAKLLFFALSGHLERFKVFWNEVKPNIKLGNPKLLAILACTGDKALVEKYFRTLKHRPDPEVAEIILKCAALSGSSNLLEFLITDKYFCPFEIDFQEDRVDKAMAKVLPNEPLLQPIPKSANFLNSLVPTEEIRRTRPILYYAELSRVENCIKAIRDGSLITQSLYRLGQNLYNIWIQMPANEPKKNTVSFSIFEVKKGDSKFTALQILALLQYIMDEAAKIESVTERKSFLLKTIELNSDKQPSHRLSQCLRESVKGSYKIKCNDTKYSLETGVKIIQAELEKLEKELEKKKDLGKFQDGDGLFYDGTNIFPL